MRFIFHMYDLNQKYEGIQQKFTVKTYEINNATLAIVQLSINIIKNSFINFLKI